METEEDKKRKNKTRAAACRIFLSITCIRLKYSTCRSFITVSYTHLSLRIEAVQKLKLYQPLNIGQASRISGVSPADISVLLVYLESRR